MGEVYRARDSRLGRTVAVKVLPESLFADREHVARFEREAKLLASLNHPNIASIHAFEEISGRHLLVMELVEGEDLAQRLARGAIPVDEALPIAREIAGGLEDAHEKGIVHRDLKPANVKVSPDGKVKLLDFGLAKALTNDEAPEPDLSTSPTRTAEATAAGVILGTVAYMSPEQARGKAVDKRTDIWAFGVVLFEMIAGLRPFPGETVSDVLASILKSEPAWDALPPETPKGVVRLLERCLDRDPRTRLRDIGEARIALQGQRPGSGAATPAGVPARGRRPLLLAIALGLLVVAAAWLLVPRPPEPVVRRVEFPVPNLEAGFFNQPLVSPDGSRIAWVEDDVLRIRRLDDLTNVGVKMIGTSGDAGAGPAHWTFFWSADSGHLAFSAARKLWRVSAAGGAASPVCDIPESGSVWGGTWRSDETILFSVWRGSLYRVPAGGGRPEVLLPIDPKSEVDFHRLFLLPAGRGVLFTPHYVELGYRTLDVLAGGRRSVALNEKGFTYSHAAYSPSGHVLFDNDGEEGLWATPFSDSKLRATGKPFLVVPDGTHPSVSADGTIVYVRGAVAPPGELVRVTADGRVLGALAPAARGLGAPAISPDGFRIAVSTWENNQYDLWLYDLGRGTRTRLTNTRTDEIAPTWSPSGDRILYVQAEGPVKLLSLPAVGGAIAPVLTGSETVLYGVVTPDGKRIVFGTDERGGVGRLLSIPVDGNLVQTGPAEPVMEGPVLDGGARIAPQGDLIAYVSTEGEQANVFVRRLPSGQNAWKVSAGLGTSPRWSRQGDRVYFLSGDSLMEVEVRRTPSVEFGAPRRLFALGDSHLLAAAEFDVDAEGRFVMVRGVGEPRRIVVAIHGTRLLEESERKSVSK